ncbi:MAG: hypothetical protein LBF34_04545 [Puniceicoccales bacterium]|jgi:hypothetical protein|nr:hypothetical protein [Puniceicoccales bacterium]
MNAKVYCLGLLFSLSFGSGLKAVPGGGKNGEKSAQNMTSSGKATVVTGASTKAVTNSSVPKNQDADPLVTLEILNIQKIFECENILSPLNLSKDVANFFLLASLPWVGKDFSNLEKCTKVSMFFAGESVVVMFKPTVESKDTFSNTFRELKVPFIEQNSYFLLLLSKDNDCESLPIDNGLESLSKDSGLESLSKDSTLLALQKSESLIKRATTSTTKPEDPFKVECIVNIDAVVGADPNSIAVAIAHNLKELGFTFEFKSDGIACSSVLSVQPTFQFYKQLEKANYDKSLPSSVFKQNEDVRSYLVYRDVSWILDVFNFYVQRFYTENNLDSALEKRFLDALEGALNGIKKCIEGERFLGFVWNGIELAYFEVGKVSCKTVEEYINCGNLLSDIDKELDALFGGEKQIEAPSVPVAGNEKSKAEDKADAKSIVGFVDSPLKSAKLFCEYKGCSVYLRESEDENKTFGKVKKVAYFVVRDGLLLSSNSLDFLKSRIDTLEADKISTDNKTSAAKAPAITIETLIEGYPVGTIAKGNLKIVPWLQFCKTLVPDLGKYFADALLAKIDADGGISFEITAQGGGSAAIQLFVNNGCLKALPILVEIFNDISVDLSCKRKKAHKSMVPAKADEAKTSGFVPAKKDDKPKNSSLIPVKVAYDIETCKEEQKILIPVKILTEYKAMG